MNRDNASIIDIIKACQTIMTFTSNIKKEEFLNSNLIQSAVMHQLLIIGEAVKRLSETFKQNAGEIPWKLIAGMRDKLVHGYDIIDINEIWNTVTVDIPHLIQKLTPYKPE